MERYVIIDLETTGHSPTENDKIIEVGMVIVDNDTIVDDYSTLFNPNKKIPPFISNLTGIRNEDVQNAPTFKEKAKKMIELCGNHYLIAHNVPFDLSFLNTELSNHGLNKLTNPVLDTVELARILYPQAPSYKLGQLAEYLGIFHESPHRALSDAYVTAKLFLKLKEKLNALPYETVTHLINLEKMLKSDLYALLEQRQQALAFSTTETKNIESFRGLAFKQIQNSKEKSLNLDMSFGDYLDSIYEWNGSMQKQMKNFEKRDGQREMSEDIFDAFQSHKHGLIEAETGTGKSLAYLITAIYEALRSNKRLVISTYTTQLQTQLLDEEIPLLQKLISLPFQAALLKGKHHYLSLEKFEHELTSSEQDNYGITLTKAMILVWITETETGDIDEIHLPSNGYFFYKKIASDTESYVDPTSPWFSKSYYQKARNKAQQANIIITNHALLCTDIFNDYQFLPSYDKAIIDEAHHFEDIVSRHYGLQLDYSNMQYNLNQIGTTDDGKWLNRIVEKCALGPNALSLEKWNEIFLRTKYEVDDLFRTLFQYVMDQKVNKKSVSDIGRIQYKIEEDQEASKAWQLIKEMANRLSFLLRDLIHILSFLDQQMDKQEVFDKYDKEDLKRHLQHLQNFIDHLESFFLLNASATHVKWVEMERHSFNNAIYLYSEPTEVAALLAQDFFDKKESIILTSATLTMRNSFSFIVNRLGLDSEKLITNKIISPFDYTNQVQLMVPNDFPDIKHGNLGDFIYSTCEAILSLAEITKGRMLVLFTSYNMLKRSYSLLREIMDLNQYVLIAQGISSGSRTRLKKNFQTFDKAILLGTSSFWEGVDIPGEDLSCLMIVRLPFQPPDHPVYEARANHIKKERKNAFFELALPNAVIRFKQGFGRLIRSKKDRGIVFVCDARIMKARYGKFFIESIPNVPVSFQPTYELMNKADEWF
ncbi:ATP-dependent DNA helicase DinG [Virgibacillus alimentarius]|uniref:ATP-dependent DNA helicase DinG n=1 Tax=Virgibacillus alimentarius TaxID=698769 RepID=UPI0004935DA9|nr:ATP-dependent DNA helicase DinG [Virgibacillus alimentarius]